MVDLMTTDLRVHIPKHRLHNCIQVLTSNKLSSTDCSLPPYCQNSTYFEVSSGWWTNIGLCVGSQTTFHNVHINENYVQVWDENWYSVYTIVSKSESMYITPGISDEYRVIHNDKQYAVTTQSIIKNSYFITPSTGKILRPTLSQTMDGRFCIPTFKSDSTIPLVPKFYNSLKEALYNADIPVWVDMPNSNVCLYKMAKHTISPFSNPNITRPVTLAIGYKWNTITNSPQPYSESIFTNVSQSVICRPYDQTSNVLPIGVSTIVHTIAHAFTTLANQVFYYVTLMCERLYSLILEYWDKYRLDSFIIILLIICYKTSNIYSAILISIFIQHIILLFI